MIDEFPGSHSLWDFRLEVYTVTCWDQCLLSVVPYGAAANWTDVPLERWNEDENLTTVFQPNPIHALNDDFLWDMDDALDAVPWRSQDGAYDPVTLRELGAPVAGTYYLTGTYANIRDFPSGFFPGGDIGAPHTPVPASQNGSFSYMRDQNDFNAVMCYYHITENQLYLQDIGFTNACNRQIGIDADAIGGADNAMYKARPDDSGKGFLLFGNGGTDTGEDADVILHEYCHAIIDDIAPFRFIAEYGQTSAIMEGTADYWACSWADSFHWSPFPSAFYAEWDARHGPFEPPYIRRVNTGKTLADSTGDPHVDGEIWSRALWDLHGTLGKRVTDSLILRAIEITHADSVHEPAMYQVAFRMIQADTQAYAAAHAVDIGQAFLDREIIQCYCPWQGDLDRSGVINATDLTLTINIIFFGGLNVQDPTCPAFRADFNDDSLVDAIDLVFLIQHIFFGGSGPWSPC